MDGGVAKHCVAEHCGRRVDEECNGDCGGVELSNDGERKRP